MLRYYSTLKLKVLFFYSGTYDVEITQCSGWCNCLQARGLSFEF